MNIKKQKLSEYKNLINQWHPSKNKKLTPETLTLLAQEVGESTILSRTGGAPTFAIGMAHIITEIFNSREMMAFWYHFAILFEALFILTAVDAGTRACRFMVQDTVCVNGLGRHWSLLLYTRKSL